VAHIATVGSGRGGPILPPGTRKTDWKKDFCLYDGQLDCVWTSVQRYAGWADRPSSEKESFLQFMGRKKALPTAVFMSAITE
jgi:hypothetical protein